MSERAEPATRRAHEPVDLAGLAVFRVGFGALMFINLGRYWLEGWIHEYFLAPAYLVPYPGFGWVTRVPGAGMYVVFAVLMVAALCVAVGLRYRVAAWVLAVGLAYLFLLSATMYLNHAYLIALVAVLMACVPAARGLSIDARRRPAERRAFTPAWAPWLLRAQIAVVYVYGGVAKLDPDWVSGQSVRLWLAERVELSPGWIAGLLRHEQAATVITWGGLGFDLLIVPALLWRRTRALAVIASLCFHLSNAFLFDIGVFPWFMLLATTLFFAPDWPRRVPRIGPWIDAELGPVPSAAPSPPRPWLVPTLCAVWLALQVLVPLRRHLYPGPTSWTEEGHYLSWRMMLRAKAGRARYSVHAPSTNESWTVDPAEELTELQAKRMASKPDLVVLYAHHLAERWQQERGLEVEVRAKVYVSLNGRAWRLLVDPSVDLTKVAPSLGPASWIMPAPAAEP